MNERTELLIVGGGPVGATLALALVGSGVDVTLLEARPADAPANDRRTLALSEGSRQILQRLGVWSSLSDAATTIDTIHISQRGSLGRSVMRAVEQGLPHLGYVLSYGALSQALDRAMQRHSVQVRFGTRVHGLALAPDGVKVHSEQGSLQAAMVVLADGGQGLAEAAGLQRETREYQQHAVVGHVECTEPHGHVAYERFTPQGPVALLPEGSRGFALVWTAEPAPAAELCALPEQQFLAQLHCHFGDRVGDFLSVGPRAAFPLRLSRVRPVTAQRLAVIGNAAQTLHPVAGQGFNLGLRDAWELALTIKESAPAALGTPALLERYRRRRQFDTRGGMLFTDLLVRAFSNEIPGVGTLRGAGLAATELVAPIKRFIAGRMSYGAHG